MKKLLSYLCIGLIFLLPGISQLNAGPANEYEYSGPYTHKNLSVFLINGKNGINAENFLTLQEAMQKDLVIVYETGDVDQLIITNKSGKYTIFIMSGDIVKGGKQDRVIKNNLIIPPKTKNMKLSSFCVESNRWQQRGNEEASKFSSSQKRIASKNLKISVRKEESQQGVWSNVSKIQSKLGSNVGRVQSDESASSLQLTLEHKNLAKIKEEYVNELKDIGKNKKNIIGYAYAINGRINSAEIFASDILFDKLWDKLLESIAVEAISEYEKGKSYKQIKVSDIESFIVDAEKGKKISEKYITKRTNLVEKESDEFLYYETKDKENKDQWINKSYMKK